MDNYIIRIYRYEKNNPDKLVGTVEHVGLDGKRAFTHVDELWEILNATGQMPKKNQKGASGRRENTTTQSKVKAGGDEG
jgi:predicted amidophosphoribosyltransferase